LPPRRPSNRVLQDNGGAAVSFRRAVSCRHKPPEAPCATPPARETEDLAAQVDRAVQASDLADLDAGLGPFDRAVNKVVEVLGSACWPRS
jgi:hypothetical protein